MLRHFLGIENINKEELHMLLNNAVNFVEVSERELKKVPALRGKTVVNLFVEASTRTRTSFEIAAKRLSADLINIAAASSSMTKGETLLDTAKTLEAMSPDILVIRHSESGAPHFLAKHLKTTAVVNAGDGMHEHPTQALLDALTIKLHFAKSGRGLEGLKLAIVGDVRHSRVARSNIWLHKLLGNEVRLIGPATLVPKEFGCPTTFNGFVPQLYKDRSGLKGVDVVMVLRMQTERQAANFVPSMEEYSREFGINERILKEYAPDAVVLHPGPVNRGIELSSEVMDGPRSLISNQVNNGVAARMAVLFSLATGSRE